MKALPIILTGLAMLVIVATLGLTPQRCEMGSSNYSIGTFLLAGCR
jgi:hypothetical protein